MGRIRLHTTVSVGPRKVGQRRKEKRKGESLRKRPKPKVAEKGSADRETGQKKVNGGGRRGGFTQSAVCGTTSKQMRGGGAIGRNHRAKKVLEDRGTRRGLALVSEGRHVTNAGVGKKGSRNRVLNGGTRICR